jgi:uncharacterized caspase-like protein
VREVDSPSGSLIRMAICAGWVWDFTMRLVAALTCAVVLIGLGVQQGQAETRVALVIGNSAYRNVAQLDNPANDARLLAETLRSLGFTLIGGGAQLDLDKPAFDRAVQTFGDRLAGADVGLFYYAGHGVQVRGENQLIPVDANPTKEADIDFQMLNSNLVLRQMELAGTRLNIVILDACRNNPFGGRGLAVGRARDAESTRMRDTSAGLAQMQAPQGTLISFATQPGSVAQDGSGGNSPYARALAETIRKPGIGIFDAFNQIGLQVKRTTGGAQQPWVSSSPIDGAFYFVPPVAAAANSSAAGLVPEAAKGQETKQDTKQETAAHPRAEMRITTLEQSPRSSPVAPTPAAPPAGQSLAQEIKKELKRLGCYSGRIDEKWPTIEAADSIKKFAQRAGLLIENPEPTAELLDVIRGRPDRLCTQRATSRSPEIARSTNRESPPGELHQGPQIGSLSLGAKALVDDGACPNGQIKQITGGSRTKGIPRETKCVARN